MVTFTLILGVLVVVLEILIISCYGQPCLLNQTDTCLDNCPRGYRHFPDCDECVDPRLDPLNNCTKCKSTEENCQTGNFTLAVLFHSYVNENHLCGECREQEFGRVCCDSVNSTSNCSSDCEVRMIVSVEAFQSLPRHVNLQPHDPDFSTDRISVIEQGPEVFNYSNISNPYEVQLQTWTERFQFYIVMYDFYQVDYTDRRGQAVVDRFLININLGPCLPASLLRKTYSGIYNISSFDLSFSVRCNSNSNDNEYNISCIRGNDGSCDRVGTRSCQNETRSSVNYSSSSSSLISGCTLSNSTGFKGYIYGPIIGGLVALLLLFCMCCIFLLRTSHKQKAVRKETNAGSSSTGNDGYERMSYNNRNEEIVIETNDEYEYIRIPNYIKPHDNQQNVYVM